MILIVLENCFISFFLNSLKNVKEIIKGSVIFCYWYIQSIVSSQKLFLKIFLFVYSCPISDHIRVIHIVNNQSERLLYSGPISIISEVIHVVNIQSERTQRNLDVYWNNIWVYERVERFQMCNKCYFSCDPIQHVVVVDVSWFSWIHWYKIEVKIDSTNHWILKRFENMI